MKRTILPFLTICSILFFQGQITGQPCKADFKDTTGTANLEVDFTEDANVNPDSVKWYFGDNDSSTITNPTHQYAQPGTYNVCLVVHKNLCVDTTCMDVQVNCSSPTAGFDFQKDSLTLSFTDTSKGNPTEWEWDFGDGFLSGKQNPTHQYNERGTYTVCLTAADSVCADTVCKEIEVSCETPVAKASRYIDLTTVEFGDSSKGDPDSWVWAFGDGDTSYQQHPTHTYDSAGSYRFYLIAGEGTCYDTLTDPLDLIACRSDFFFTSDSSSRKINFSDAAASVSGITKRKWDFGDGFFSTKENPSHTYEKDSTYRVCQMIETQDGCTDTTCYDIDVGSQPCEADFTSSTELTTATFMDASPGDPDSLQWTFGDGASGKGSNPSHTYDEPGSYEVCLTVYEGQCTHQVCKTIEVTNCKANFSSVPDTAATGNAVDFTDESNGNISSWRWEFGDDIISEKQNPTHVYDSMGVYNACLEIETDSGCMDRVCKDVKAGFPLCEADFAFEDSVTKVFFSDSSGYNTTGWKWDFGDGETSTKQNPVHTYPDTGTYTVCLMTTVDDSLCSDTICRTIELKDCKAAFDHELDSSGNGVSFIDQSGGNPNNWRWEFGDGSISEQQNPHYTYQEKGGEIACLAIENQGGCKDTTCNVIPVGDVDCNANFGADQETGLTVNFTDSSSFNPSSWKWDFGDSTTSTQQNPSHTYDSEGTYIVCLTIKNDTLGCEDQVCEIIDVVDNSGSDCEASFEYEIVDPNTYTVSFQNTSSAGGGIGTQYNWQFGDDSTASEENPVHSYQEPGTYQVCLSVNDLINQCNTNSCQTIQVGDVGINEDGRSISDLKVYPVPAKDRTNVQFGLEKSTKVTITVSDVLGRKVETLHDGTLPAGMNRLEWAIGERKAGIYLLRVKTEHGKTRTTRVSVKD